MSSYENLAGRPSKGRNTHGKQKRCAQIAGRLLKELHDSIAARPIGTGLRYFTEYAAQVQPEGLPRFAGTENILYIGVYTTFPNGQWKKKRIYNETKKKKPLLLSTDAA